MRLIHGTASRENSVVHKQKESKGSMDVCLARLIGPGSSSLASV